MFVSKLSYDNLIKSLDKKGFAYKVKTSGSQYYPDKVITFKTNSGKSITLTTDSFFMSHPLKSAQITEDNSNQTISKKFNLVRDNISKVFVDRNGEKSTRTIFHSINGKNIKSIENKTNEGTKLY